MGERPIREKRPSVGDYEEVSAMIEITHIPGYELVAPIGGGAFGQVYLARKQGLHGFEKIVVIKRMMPHLALNKRYLDMFLDEARLAAKIHDARVAEIHELGEADGVPYMVMEYLAGESVASILGASLTRDVKLPFELAARIAAEVAGGLQKAHELADAQGKPLGVVHRDVTPSNVIVVYTGNVKLLDFGVAKARSNVAITDGGELKGKLGYYSPEQIHNRDVDRRSDLFSLGVMLWEMLTVRRLFGSTDSVKGMQQTLSMYIPPPSQHSPDVPAPLDEITLKLLARDPAKRFQTAEELQIALEEFLASVPRPSGTLHLGMYMKRSFADRVNMHARLLEASTTAQVSQTKVTDVVKALAETKNTSFEALQPTQMTTPLRSPKLRIAIVAGALIAIGIVLAIVLSSGSKGTEIVAVSIDAAPVRAPDAAPTHQTALDKIESAIRTGRIASPPGDNALEQLVELERIAPGEQRIAELRTLAVEELLAAAKSLWDHDRKSSARSLYADVLLFDPKQPLALERSKAPPAPRNRPASPARDDARVVWLVAQIELAIVERRFVAPKDRNALDLLLELRQRDPGNDAAKRLGGEVALALDQAANKATGQEQSDLAAAAKKARALEPKDTAKPEPPKADTAAAQAAVRDGQADLAAGRFDEARRSFDRAIAADPRSHAALGGLAEVAFNEKDYTRAVLAAQRAIAIAPGAVPYRMTLAKTYYKMLRYQDALTHWERVIQIDPGNAVAKKNADMARRKLEP